VFTAVAQKFSLCNIIRRCGFTAAV